MGVAKETTAWATPPATAAALQRATRAKCATSAKKHGLTDDEVKALIKQHGNDRKTLEAAVAQSRGETTS